MTILDGKKIREELLEKYKEIIQEQDLNIVLAIIQIGDNYSSNTYVKNKEAELKGRQHEVSGMLLYAKTDEEIYPNHEYRMSGNRIAVRTLDLNGDFGTIREQLDAIAGRFLNA